MTEGSIYGSIVNLATSPFKWLASIVQRMRKERRVVTAREELFALHDHTPAAGHNDQLAFRANDAFLLKSDQDKNWWHVKHIPSGRSGYVPMSFVASKSEKVHMEWCNMYMTRDDAMRSLSKTEFEPGSFIIRMNNGRSFTEALALSVKTSFVGEKQFLHYLIERGDGKFWLHGCKFPRKFFSITHLVQYYAGHHSAMEQPLVYSVKKRAVIEVWLIRLADIEVNTQDATTELGSGFFGKVFKGKLRGDIVAIKTVNLNKMTKEKFMREAEIARDFSHRNIVKTIGVCSEPPYIITEFMPGGSLKKYLLEKRIPPAEYILVAQKIACAMAHLEEKGIVHRDLAARNILVGEDHSIIKLADFGLARDILEAEYYSTDSEIFPAKWTAPEAYVIGGKKGKSTTASDVWSFAVVMWEIWSKGSDPYPDTSALEIYHKLRVDNYRLVCPFNCPPVIYNKMLECWNFDPTVRPSFAELYTFLLDPYGYSQAQSEAMRRPISRTPPMRNATEEDVIVDSSESVVEPSQTEEPTPVEADGALESSESIVEPLEAQAMISSSEDDVSSHTSESIVESPQTEDEEVSSSETSFEHVEMDSFHSLVEKADLHSSQTMVEFFDI